MITDLELVPIDIRPSGPTRDPKARMRKAIQAQFHILNVAEQNAQAFDPGDKKELPGRPWWKNENGTWTVVPRYGVKALFMKDDKPMGFNLGTLSHPWAAIRKALERCNELLNSGQWDKQINERAAEQSKMLMGARSARTGLTAVGDGTPKRRGRPPKIS